MERYHQILNIHFDSESLKRVFVLRCSLFFFRKIEIVQFASRTRQLFVRLLALVKWANSASKVDKCGVSTESVQLRSERQITSLVDASSP